jgi:CMP-N,N'-diacetyllegionaminic acid synthase
MQILITICARGGSKGIPGKNIKKLNGKPLIAYSIEIAKIFSKIYKSDIVLSTDSINIKDIAAEFGLITKYDRPAHLSLDTTGKIETLKDILMFQENIMKKEYDYILDLDITSPLRNIDDIEKGFDILKQNDNAFNIFSVSQANRNPYFNIVEEKENGFYNVVKKGKYFSRQQAPSVYDMNSSFYIYKKSFFNANQLTTTTDKSLIYVMPHICFDLDHLIDFDFMEYLIINKKLDFKF